jgi:hypothetical protein
MFGHSKKNSGPSIGDTTTSKCFPSFWGCGAFHFRSVLYCGHKIYSSDVIDENTIPPRSNVLSLSLSWRRNGMDGCFGCDCLWLISVDRGTVHVYHGPRLQRAGVNNETSAPPSCQSILRSRLSRLIVRPQPDKYGTRARDALSTRP